MRWRTTSRVATTSVAHPVRRRYSASTLRACAASTAAQPVSCGAHEQHLAGVGVRRPRLVVQVVAVVPDRHQTEVLHRREHGGAGADHDAHRPAADREERAVALGRAGVGRQHHVAALPQPLGERSVEPSDVAVVGNADEGSPAGSRRRHHGLGEHLGPVVAGKHRPDGPR